MTNEAIQESIEQNLTGPKKVTGDSGSVEQHSLSEQIAAAKHLASQKAVQSKGLGIKLTKLSPDGTV